MDGKHRVKLSLIIAEWQQIIGDLLVDLEKDDDVEEVINAIGRCEAAARRWHMREAVKSGHIDMPAIEEFDDAKANVFDD